MRISICVSNGKEIATFKFFLKYYLYILNPNKVDIKCVKFLVIYLLVNLIILSKQSYIIKCILCFSKLLWRDMCISRNGLRLHPFTTQIIQKPKTQILLRKKISQQLTSHNCLTHRSQTTFQRNADAAKLQFYDLNRSLICSIWCS